MEASMFASVTQKVGVKAGDVCVTLIDRLKGDQVRGAPRIYGIYVNVNHIALQITITIDQKHEFEQRPFFVVGRYIKRLLQQ